MKLLKEKNCCSFLFYSVPFWNQQQLAEKAQFWIHTWTTTLSPAHLFAKKLFFKNCFEEEVALIIFAKVGYFFTKLKN